MKDIIERKNALLKESYEKLSNIRKIALAMGGTMFDTTEAADVYVEVMSRVISELTLGCFQMLEESQKAEPEAVEDTEDVLI